MDKEGNPTCPHCGARLLKWMPPSNSSWGNHYQYACFNDECPYYVRGWDHMMKNYQARASYRYRLDPVTGESGPLPVWSRTAIRDLIIEAKDEEK